MLLSWLNGTAAAVMLAGETTPLPETVAVSHPPAFHVPPPSRE